MNAVDDESWLAQLTVSKAIGRMIIDHANGLHEGITNRRADEHEAPAFQLSTDGIRNRRVAGNVAWRFPAIGDRSAVNECPDILIKAADLLLDQKKSLRIGNGRLNLKSVPNDPGVAQQASYFSCVVPGDCHWVKVIKGRPESIALLKNGVPTQPGLRPFKDEKFKQPSIVVYGDAPFLVMVLGQEWVGGPGTSCRCRPTRHQSLSRLSISTMTGQ